MSEISSRVKVSVLGGIAIWIFARSVFAADLPAPRFGLAEQARPAPIAEKR